MDAQGRRKVFPPRHKYPMQGDFIEKDKTLSTHTVVNNRAKAYEQLCKSGRGVRIHDFGFAPTRIAAMMQGCGKSYEPVMHCMPASLN
jgi:hypothetical protein